jgi:hypothetical protein
MSEPAYQPCGILGLAMTPKAIAERRAREEWEKQLMQLGGVAALSVADPESFAELYPNLALSRN